MNPPKCKSCGAAEWRHTCGPAHLINVAEKTMVTSIKTVMGSTEEQFQRIDQMAALHPGPVAKGAKIDRKEYLKLKARERRARQKASKP